MSGEQVAAGVFVAEDHQPAFGGKPLACAAGIAVLNELESPGFLERIRSAISSWAFPCAKDARGLMTGVDIDDRAAAEVQKARLEASPKGLCTSTAGQHTLRIVPPLVITNAEIDEGLAVLKDALEGHS